MWLKQTFSCFRIRLLSLYARPASPPRCHGPKKIAAVPIFLPQGNIEHGFIIDQSPPARFDCTIVAGRTKTPKIVVMTDASSFGWGRLMETALATFTTRHKASNYR